MTRAEANTAIHIDGQSLLGELVRDGQALELLAVGRMIEHEVVGPQLLRAAPIAPPTTARRLAGPRNHASGHTQRDVAESAHSPDFLRLGLAILHFGF